jgi:hypothetical protein
VCSCPDTPMKFQHLNISGLKAKSNSQTW